VNVPYLFSRTISLKHEICHGRETCSNVRSGGKKIGRTCQTRLPSRWTGGVEKGKIHRGGLGTDAATHRDLETKNCRERGQRRRDCLKCDRGMLVNAILGEPSCYHLKDADVAKCVDVLLQEQRAWLPEGWFK